MPPLPPSPQRLAWCRRADLQTVPLLFQGEQCWGIKDPLTLTYFELREEEYFVLNQLDGRTTAEQVCRAFGERFRPRTLSMAELLGFVSQLISQGLLVADRMGYGHMLVDRDRMTQSRRRWSRLTNILAIRFRGIDPDRFLGWLVTRLGWLFSSWAIAFGVMLIASALALVVVQFDTLIRRLPDAHAMLTTSNLILLSLLLCVVKVLHELGHAMTCKYLGGECHELGAMLLVFTPTLYCNVSDIWMIPDKWKRIAVSAAGMWVEAVIAAICTLLWWYSAPGLFHSLCINVMFICGVSTFVFNGNPLLRYDGYFVIADWLEIPNLQQKAMETVRSKLAAWYCFPNAREDFEVANHQKWLLISYGIASSVYRIGLTALILWSLHRWLQPIGLGSLVRVFAVLTISLMVLSPIMATIRFLRSPATRAAIDWLRFGLRSGVTLIALVLIFNVPLPDRVIAGAILDQDAAMPVYVTLPGTLVRGVKHGDRLDAGDEVAILFHSEIEEERIRTEGEVRQHRVRLEQLERRRISEPEISAMIPAVREALRDFEKQLQQLNEAADRLTLRAPVSGHVLPPPRQHSRVATGTLSNWTGSPLDPRNTGCFLRPGTMVCFIGNVESRAALVLINQDDVNLVKIGQSVRLHWDELPGEVISGEIAEIAALDLNQLSREMITRLNIPARSAGAGGLRPVDTWYQARVRMNEPNTSLLRGSAGRAAIITAHQTLWNRSCRWLGRTFPM